MDIKESLRELNENFDLPPEEYKNLAGFKELEQQPDIVDSLLAARIPEVVKLACLSDMIPADEFFYMEKLYADISDNEIKDVLLKVKTLRDFRTLVVEMADISVLKKIKAYFGRMDKERNVVKNKEQQLISECRKFVSQHASQREIDGIKSGDIEIPEELKKKRQELDELQTERKILNSNILHINPYREYIDDALIGYKDAIERNKRYKKACIDIDVKRMEDFLKEYIRTQNIPKEYEELDNKSMANLLQVLSQSCYRGYRLPILVNLHKAKVLQLGNEVVSGFLLGHGNDVNDYLVEQLDDTEQEMLKAEENTILLDVLIKRECENASRKYSCQDICVWKFIKDGKIWQWIFQRLSECSEDKNIVHVMTSILSMLDDNAEIFVRALLNYENDNRKFSSFAVAKELLSAGISSNRTALLVLLDALERRQAANRREINTLARGERARSQELFSAIYQPMENLEELTINLMTNKEHIPREMIGSQLAATVVSMCEGLENMGIYPLAEPADWQHQRVIQFIPEYHLKPTGYNENIQKAQLYTMGFRYKNEENEDIIHLAKVYDAKDNRNFPKGEFLNKDTNKQKNVRNHNLDKRDEWYSPVHNKYRK